MATYEISIDGIPALAEVTYFYKHKGLGFRADSADDAVDYMEWEYTIKDRKGYPKVGDSEWLKLKVDDKDLWSDINEQILREMDKD
jgi:hypothetical protein